MKTVLVTGASGGIGKAIVSSFAQREYFVAAQYNNNLNSLLNLKKQLNQENNYGDYLSFYKADFSHIEQAENLYNSVIKDLNHIDVLICNAGIDLYKLTDQTSLEDWRKLFSVNTESAFVLSKLCLEQMRKRGNGKIIFVSSMWGVVGGCLESAYSASKSALIGYCKSLAKEVGGNGITVNCVCPGYINTPMNSNFSDSEKAEIIEKTPLKRAGTPQDVASLISFLTSEEASFITGQSIVCDGGYTL